MENPKMMKKVVLPRGFKGTHSFQVRAKKKLWFLVGIGYEELENESCIKKMKARGEFFGRRGHFFQWAPQNFDS